MLELHLKHEGDGRFTPQTRDDWRKACEELEPGEVLLARIVHIRSMPEHRLFFGAIRSAWDNQRGGPLFIEAEGGWERLRAWLLCEAGHCETITFDHGTMSESAALRLKRRDTGNGVHSFWSVRQSTGTITCKTPLSVSHKLCKHEDFQPVKDRVFELLCNVICPGTTPEELMAIRYTRPKVKRARKKSDGGQTAATDGTGDRAVVEVG